MEGQQRQIKEEEENKGQPVVQVKQETHGERPGSSQEERTCKLFRHCIVIKI